MSHRLLLLVLLGLTTGLLSACGDENGDRAAQNDTKRALADAAFVADMIPHHQGAIDMAAIALERSTRGEIRDLARIIVSAQKREIATMRQIARDLPTVKPSSDADHGDAGAHGEGHDATAGAMGMGPSAMGMDIDLDELRAAKPFDRAFIDAMIPHHEGALRTAEALRQNGSEPRLRAIADDVLASQRREIDQMRVWRERWY